MEQWNMPRQYLSVRLPFKGEWLAVVGQTDGTFAVDVLNREGGCVGDTRVVQPHHLARAIEDISKENRGEK